MSNDNPPSTVEAGIKYPLSVGQRVRLQLGYCRDGDPPGVLVGYAAHPNFRRPVALVAWPGADELHVCPTYVLVPWRR